MSLRLLARALVLGAIASPALLAFADSSAALVLRSGEETRLTSIARAAPLDRLVVLAPAGDRVEVRDGAGRVYVTEASATGRVEFVVGGALGTHEIRVQDDNGTGLTTLRFDVDAETGIQDEGKYADMLQLFRKGMATPVGEGDHVDWNGKRYRFFVSWGLDHYHTMKGMKYFSPHGAEMVDMMRAAQREDGLIWSFVQLNDGWAYYVTCYGPFGYVRRYGDRYFVRQPTENHPEYIYVSTIYQNWKASGDDAWMKEALDSAKRALDYTAKDPARWSRRFELLKRVYTIDSWDFQVDDQYTPKLGLTDTMLVHPEKSKFGVFFGDNTHYASACEELGEMLAHVGDQAGATTYRERAAGIRSRLDRLAWNGRFFTHFIEEDPTVHRDLGVDEKSQIAQGNAYSLNRGVTHAQATAIMRTYQDLKQHLPPGSPGEWYAIYPPFRKGFGEHNTLWQYMNGGVGGHVAGELARGAFEHGGEAYAVDILDRLTALGHQYGDKIWFAYTGSIPPPPPPPHYTPVDLSPIANMDKSTEPGAPLPFMGLKESTGDMRELPTGQQTLANVPFHLAEPDKNARKVFVGLAQRAGFKPSAEVPIGASASSIYLLHLANDVPADGVCGSMTLQYEDGTHHTEYLLATKHVSRWVFPSFAKERAGIAWKGPSTKWAEVGISWCAIDNPHPEKKIRALTFRAPDTGMIYALAGVTLSDRPHYVLPSPTSFGGPDNWAAATAMAALIEGLAGVKDTPGTVTFSRPRVSPRWPLTSTNDLKATVRYAQSHGYVAYRFTRRSPARELEFVVTSGAEALQLHVPLPTGASAAPQVRVDGQTVTAELGAVESTRYVDLTLASGAPQTVTITY